jgi:hypothetical protein
MPAFRRGQKIVDKTMEIIDNVSLDVADTIKGVHEVGSVWHAVELGHTDEVMEAVRNGSISLLDQDPHELMGKTVTELCVTPLN